MSNIIKSKYNYVSLYNTEDIDELLPSVIMIYKNYKIIIHMFMLKKFFATYDKIVNNIVKNELYINNLNNDISYDIKPYNNINNICLCNTIKYMYGLDSDWDNIYINDIVNMILWLNDMLFLDNDYIENLKTLIIIKINEINIIDLNILEININDCYIYGKKKYTKINISKNKNNIPNINYIKNLDISYNIKYHNTKCVNFYTFYPKFYINNIQLNIQQHKNLIQYIDTKKLLSDHVYNYVVNTIISSYDLLNMKLLNDEYYDVNKLKYDIINLKFNLKLLSLAFYNELFYKKDKEFLLDMLKFYLNNKKFSVSAYAINKIIQHRFIS